jgi:hypothetical protein
VELQLSESCHLRNEDYTELQALLSRNVVLANKRVQRALRRRERTLLLLQRKRRDDAVDFYLWENAERLGIYQLNAELRREMRMVMAREARTLSRIQAAFLRRVHEEARRQFLVSYTLHRNSISMSWEEGVLQFERLALDAREQRVRAKISSMAAQEMEKMSSQQKKAEARLLPKVASAAQEPLRQQHHLPVVVASTSGFGTERTCDEGVAKERPKSGCEDETKSRRTRAALRADEAYERHRLQTNAFVGLYAIFWLRLTRHRRGAGPRSLSEGTEHAKPDEDIPPPASTLLT